MITNTLWSRIKTLEAQMQLAFAKDAQIVGSFFQNGGNSFGVPAVLGTNDAQPLSIETNGVTRVAMTAAGAVTITGAAASSFTSTAALTLTAGASSTWSTTAGTLTIQSAGVYTITSITAAGTSQVVSGSGLSVTATNTLGLSSTTGAFTLAGAIASTIQTTAGGLTITGGGGLTATSTAGISITCTGGSGMTVGTTDNQIFSILQNNATRASFNAGGGIQFIGGAASSYSTSAGANTFDAATAVNIATTNATSLNLGNSTNTAALTIGVTAGNLTASGTAIMGGGAIPATLNYLSVTINGVARKIPFCSP